MIQALAEQYALTPGIHHAVPFETYRNLRALNQSILKLLDPELGSPLHAKAAFDGLLKLPETNALRLGQREHCWIVEGEEEFRSRFRISEPCGALLKSGDCKDNPCGKASKHFAHGQWRCGTHGNGMPEVEDCVSPDDLERIRLMGESLRRHEINVHLNRRGWSEATLVYDLDISVAVSLCPKCEGWEHPKKFRVGWERWRCWRCGADIVPKVISEAVTLRHKTRIDRLAEPTGKHPHLVVELKRMQLLKGSRWEREKTIRTYGWDVQAAMETEAVKAVLGVERCDLIWVFVEEAYPYDVTWFPASEDTLRIGREKLRRYRQIWAECEVSGCWPGRCVGSQSPGGLPDREVKQYFKEHADDHGRLPSEVNNE